MNTLQAIVLGIIQGLAEFLPISSSAHLIIVPWLLQWKEHTLVFDVALHMGTLLALGVYFFKDYINLINSGITKPASENGKIFWCIVIATIPAAIFGLAFEHFIETKLRGQICIIAILIFLFGLIIYFADKFSKKEKEITKIKILDAIIIGVSQAFALFPGVSRSGITMTTGLFLGYKRDQAAKFSFLLSGPVILGAGVLSFIKNIHTIKSELSFFVIGMLTAAVVGFMAIHFLLNYLKTKSFLPFVIYRILLAIFIFAVFFIRGF